MTRPIKSSSTKTTRTPARERLLDAAAEVFARDGLTAATTREIAQTADVNEVTLFRLFKNKQNLLAEVLKRVFGSPTRDTAQPLGAEKNIGEAVRKYAADYASRLGKNLALVRVLLGEIQHFQEHEIMVIRGIFRPERQQLIDFLRAAQQAGHVRKDADPMMTVDQLCALIFMALLKSSMPLSREYGAKDYFDYCVETIVRAIEIPAAAKATKTTGKKGKR